MHIRIYVYDNDKVVYLFIVHTQTEALESDCFGPCVFLASSPFYDTLCTDMFLPVN